MNRSFMLLMVIVGTMAILSTGIMADDHPAVTMLSGNLEGGNIEYLPGAKMTFRFKLQSGQDADAQFVKLICRGDNGKNKAEKIFSGGGDVCWEAKLDKPGFVQVKAVVCDCRGAVLKNCNGGNRPVEYVISGGVGITELQQGVAEPGDFDEFWTKTKKTVLDFPISDVKKEFVEKRDGCEIYYITVPCPGEAPVTGCLTVTENAKPKSLPLRVVYMGYGVESSPAYRSRKRITFIVNSHGVKNGRPKEYYEKLRKGRLAGFGFKNNEIAEKSGFYGMFTRIVKVQQFVKTLPEWDGRELVVSGGSQGGFQAIAAAAFDNNVSRCQVDIPWCCDLGGITVGRFGGWRPEFVPALGYFDPVNHAKRIKCPTVITGGLGDTVCPPSGIAVLFNNLQVPATLTLTQGQGHSGSIPGGRNQIVFEKNQPGGSEKITVRNCISPKR